MISINCSAASLRDPRRSKETVISSEEALFCDGSECDPYRVFLEEEEPELMQPHWHLIVRGKSPEAGPRRYPIWGQ